MESEQTTLLQGTLDMLILKSLVAGVKPWKRNRPMRNPTLILQCLLRYQARNPKSAIRNREAPCLYS